MRQARPHRDDGDRVTDNLLHPPKLAGASVLRDARTLHPQQYRDGRVACLGEIHLATLADIHLLVLHDNELAATRLQLLERKAARLKRLEQPGGGVGKAGAFNRRQVRCLLAPLLTAQASDNYPDAGGLQNKSDGPNLGHSVSNAGSAAQD